MKLKHWAVVSLALNVIVILGGAFVSATGSGAGCGDHWPDCNGQIIPRPEAIETVIEFSHRATSGLALIAVLILILWARRASPAGSLIRRGAYASGVFIILESLVGALLVLREWTAFNVSVYRLIMQPVHLINTLFLLAALALTVWWAYERPGVALRGGPAGRLWRFGGAFLAMIVISATGTVISLGDLLIEGLGQNYNALVNFLYQMRPGHPAIAILAGSYVLWLVYTETQSGGGAAGRNWAYAAGALIVTQWVVGFLNVFLRVPVWTQLLHLLLADAAWLTLLAWSATVFAAPQAVGQEEHIVGGQLTQAKA
jgi:heme A synthase